MPCASRDASLIERLRAVWLSGAPITCTIVPRRFCNQLVYRVGRLYTLNTQRAALANVARRSRAQIVCRVASATFDCGRIACNWCNKIFFSRANSGHLHGAPSSNAGGVIRVNLSKSEPHVHDHGKASTQTAIAEDVQEDVKDVKRLQRSYAWYAWFPRKQRNNTVTPRQKRSPPPLPHLEPPCKCYFYFEGNCVCRNPFIRSAYCASCLYFIKGEDGHHECICEPEDLEKKPRRPRSIMLDAQLFTESLMFQFCSATLHGAYKINCEGSQADFFKKGYIIERSNATANIRVALSALYTFLSREVYRMAQLLPSIHSNDALDHLYQLEKIFCRDYYDFTRNLTSTLIDLCPVLVGLVGDLTEVRINADPQAQNVDFGRRDLDPQQIDFICSRRPNLCKNLVQWLHATEVLDVEADTYTFKPETPNYYPILRGCYVHPEKCQQLYTMLRSGTGIDSLHHPLSFELLLSAPRFDELLDDSTNEILAQGSSEQHFDEFSPAAEQLPFVSPSEQFEQLSFGQLGDSVVSPSEQFVEQLPYFPPVTDYPVTGPPPSDSQQDLVTISNVCNCECSCGAQTWHSSCNYNHPIVNDTLICVCMCNCAEPNPSSCVCEAPRHRSTRETTVRSRETTLPPRSTRETVRSRETTLPPQVRSTRETTSPQVRHRSRRSRGTMPQVRHRSTRETTSSPQVDYWPDDHFNVHPKSNVDGYTSRELEHDAEQHVVDIA